MIKHLPLFLAASLLLTLFVFVSEEQTSNPKLTKSENKTLSQNRSTSNLGPESASSETFSTLPRGSRSSGDPKFLDLETIAEKTSLTAKTPSPNKTVGHNRIPASISALSDEKLRERLPEKTLADLIDYEEQLSDFDPEHRRYFCWGPGTKPEIIEAFHRAEVTAGLTPGAVTPLAFQFLGSGHWSVTATDGSGVGVQGQPVTVTWSIAPDGTAAPALNSSGPAVGSNLIAWLDGIYPGPTSSDLTQRAWFSVLLEAMNDLGNQAGLNVVYEPNDDGAAFTSANSGRGILGTRGDIRLSGRDIDGDFGTLGFAFSPNFGDVVLDTEDSFFNNTSDNSIRLVNVLTHEGGHALGLAHVCPLNQTKLMEPSLTTAFRGAQFDDTYSLQRQYGDPLESHSTVTDNDTISNASPISISNGSVTSLRFLSLDDNSDLDLLSFTANAGEALTVRIIPADAAIGTYNEGAQNSDGSCSAGTPFNPLEQQDLTLEVLAADGTTILATANSQAIGGTEEVIELPLSETGTYYLRVDGDNASSAQLYELQAELINTAPSPFITIVSSRIIEESNSGGNGLFDPGETILLGVTLENSGNLVANNLTATLSGGRDIFPFSLVDNEASLAPSASTELQFIFAPNKECGEEGLLTLDISADSGYTTSLGLPFSLGTSMDVVLIDEGFNANSFPSDFSSSTNGGGDPWGRSNFTFSGGPVQGGAYSAGVTTAGDAFLVSPSRLLEDDGITLAFEHFYSLENQLDGAVLEASLDGGAWFDLLESAAVVTSGGYDDTITGTNRNQASLIGRNAWTGSSGGLTTTAIDLPDSWFGQNIRFRWYVAHNDGGAQTGWFINSVLLNADTNFICDPFRPTVTLSAAATNITEGDSNSTADLTLSTSLPLATNLSATPLISGAGDVSDLNESPIFDLASGDLSTSATISAIADDLNEGAEQIVFTLPSADPGFAAGTPASATLTIDESFLSWARSFGILSADPSVDFDQDGQPSLVEYLFNTDPADNNVFPDIQRIDGETQLSLVTPPRVPRPDLAVEGQASANLADWSSVGVTENDNGFSIPTADDLGFLRLKLTFDPPATIEE